MKKIMVGVLSFAFFLGAIGVVAQEKGLNKFTKPSKAKNVQISEKKVLSESERKAVDEFEQILKGKPSKPAPTPDPTIGGATGVLGDPIPTGGQKYAILVGLANYAGTENDLCVEAAKTGENYPSSDDGLAFYCKDEDAFNMKKALVEEYGYLDDGQHIFIFSDADAKYDAIKEAIDLVKSKLTADDELVFFFSGHSATGTAYDEAGVQLNPDEDLDEAMVIYDQDYAEIDFLAGGEYIPGDATYIWDDQLSAWFADAKTDRILFSFDTCRAGGMNELMFEGRVLTMSSTEAQSSWTYYLGGTQTAPDVYQESEGLFAHYFVKRAMIDGLADGSNPLKKTNPLKKDGNVAVEEAFSYASPLVKLASSNLQTPVLNDKFLNDLLLGYYLVN